MSDDDYSYCASCGSKKRKIAALTREVELVKKYLERIRDTHDPFEVDLCFAAYDKERER